jgi:ketosteroid isomerase-like protein
VVAVNDPAAVDSLAAAFERYEAALVANDLDRIDGFMWEDERLVRVGVDDRQDGFAAVQAFRRAQVRQTPPRRLCDTAVVTFGDHTAVVTTAFVPTDGSPAGRQSQTWVRMADGWRIVAAHVSWPASAARQVLDP